MGANAVQIEPLTTAIGAEIHGVDLAEPLDERTWDVIRTAFHDHLVLFFRDQDLSPERHVEFSRRFGTLEEYPFVKGIDGHPELIEIVKMPDETRNFGAGWHVDMSFRAEPPLGAVLLGVEVPPVGGDTMFGNLYLAYETLSDGMKGLLENLRGVHDSMDPTGHSQKYKGMAMAKKETGERTVTAHPMVRVHPETGRKSLFISPDYCFRLEGMTEEESRPILDYLEAHAARHEFTCRFRWRPNSIAIWDNRCCMHQALTDDLAARSGAEGFRRVMRRSTISV